MVGRAGWVFPLLFGPMLAQPGPAPESSIRVDVDLVTVPCVVTNRDGALVGGLQRDEFVLSDDGVAREIKYLWREIDAPLTLGIAVDVSGSQLQFVDEHRQTVAKFLSQVLGDRDQAFLAAIAPQARLLQDTTGSKAELLAGVDRIVRRGTEGELLGGPCQRRRPMGCGGTALWHGLFYATRLKLRPLAGRKALVVLTDGMDTGSDRSLQDVIEAAQGAGAVVYTIAYGSSVPTALRVLSPLSNLTIGMSSRRGKRSLERLALETGGYPFESPKQPLSAIFTRIEDELRSQYVLAFAPAALDGKFHKLEVKTVRSGLKVRARAGYYAEPGRQRD